MCGRFSLAANPEELARQFAFDWGDLDFVPNFNAAPTQDVLAVVDRDGRRMAQYMRWGLIPHWARDASFGSRLINARAETVAEKPSFRQAFRRRRCLILADGFYEWQRVGRRKRPMRIVMQSGLPFALAGLWEVWKDPEGQLIKSCTIITTEANPLLRPIHDRMPVILPQTRAALWLDSDIQDSGLLRDCLQPLASEQMATYEVAPLVNSPANNGPALIVPVGSGA